MFRFKNNKLINRALSMLIVLLMVAGLVPVGLFSFEAKAATTSLVGKSTTTITDAAGLVWEITKTVETYDDANAPCDYYKISSDMRLIDATAHETGADVVFVVDYSNSTSLHVNGDPNMPIVFDKQMAALRRMVEGIAAANNPGVRVGVVAFSGPSRNTMRSNRYMNLNGIPGVYASGVSLSESNEGTINGAINLMRVDDEAGGANALLSKVNNILKRESQYIMTATEAGLLLAKQILDGGRPGVEKHIILITDGFPQGSLASYVSGGTQYGISSRADTFANASSWNNWVYTNPGQNKGSYTGNVGAILARKDAASFSGVTLTAIGIFGGLNTRNPQTGQILNNPDDGDSNGYGFWNAIEFLRDINSKDRLYVPTTPDFDVIAPEDPTGTKGYIKLINLLRDKYPDTVAYYDSSSSIQFLGTGVAPSGNMIETIAQSLADELKIKFEQKYTILDALVVNSDGLTDGFEIMGNMPMNGNINGTNKTPSYNEEYNRVSMNIGALGQYISDVHAPVVNIHMDYIVKDTADSNVKKTNSNRKFSRTSITINAAGVPSTPTAAEPVALNVHAAQTSLGGPKITAISLNKASYYHGAPALAANEVYFNQSFDLVGTIDMAGVKDYIKHIWVIRGPSTGMSYVIINDENNENIYKFVSSVDKSKYPVIYDSGNISGTFNNEMASLTSGGVFTLKNLSPRSDGYNVANSDYYIYVLDNAGCFHRLKLNVIAKVPVGVVNENHINILNRQPIALNPGAPIDVNPKQHTSEMNDDGSWNTYSFTNILNFLKPYDASKKLGWIYRGVDPNGAPPAGSYGFVTQNVYFLYEPQNPDMRIVKSVSPTTPVRPTNEFDYYPANEKNMVTYSISDIGNIGNMDFSDAFWADILPVRNGVPVMDIQTIQTGIYNDRSESRTFNMSYRTTPYDKDKPNEGWVSWGSFDSSINTTFKVSDLNLPKGTHIYGIRINMGKIYCADGEEEEFRATTPATITAKVVYDGFDVNSFEAKNTAEMRGTHLYNPGNGTDNYEPVAFSVTSEVTSTVKVPTGTITDEHRDIDTGEIIPQNLPYEIDPSVSYDPKDWDTHMEKGQSYTWYKDYHGKADIPGYVYMGSVPPERVFVDNDGVAHFDITDASGVFIEGDQLVKHMYEREKPAVNVEKMASPATVYYGDGIAYEVYDIENTGNVALNKLTLVENLPNEFMVESIVTPTFANAVKGSGDDAKFVMLNVFAITTEGREIRWNKYPIQAVTPAVFYRYQLGLHDDEGVTAIKLVFEGHMPGYKRTVPDGGYDRSSAFKSETSFVLYGMANAPDLVEPIVIENTVDATGEYNLTTGFSGTVHDDAKADVLIHAPAIIDIQKDGPSRIRRGFSVRYALSNIGNKGDTFLYEHKMTDTLPTKDGQQVTSFIALYTGTFENIARYDVSFQTTKNRVITLQGFDPVENVTITAEDLGLREGEEVASFTYDFGTTFSGFKWTQAPVVELMPKGDMLEDLEPFTNHVKETAYWVSENPVHIKNDDNDIQKRHPLVKEDSATTKLVTPANLPVEKTAIPTAIPGRTEPVAFTIYNGVVDFAINNVGNGGNTELHHFTMTDNLPSGTTLVGVQTGKWLNYPGKWVRSEFNAYYKTNADEDWALFPNGSNIGADENRALIMPTLGEGEYVTAVKFDFGIVDIGFVNDPEYKPIVSVKVTGEEHANAGTIVTNEVVVDSQFGPPHEPDPLNPPEDEIFPPVDQTRDTAEVPVIKPELSISKAHNQDIILMNEETLEYTIGDLKNDSLLYLYDYTVTDTLPAEFMVEAVKTGVWNGYLDKVNVSYRTITFNTDGTTTLSDYIDLGDYDADANATVEIPESDDYAVRPYDVKITLNAPVAPGMEVDPENPVKVIGFVDIGPKDDIVINVVRVDAQFGYARNPLEPTDEERELFMPVSKGASVKTYVEYVEFPDPEKSANKDEVQYGEIFEYAMSIFRNGGNTDLENFKVIDTLPDEVRALSITTPTFNIVKDYRVYIVTNKGEKKELAEVSTTKTEKLPIKLGPDEFVKQVILELGEVPAGFADTSNMYIEVRNISPEEITYTNEVVVTAIYRDLEYSSNPATADVTPIEPDPQIPQVDKGADAERAFPTMQYSYTFGNIQNSGLCMLDKLTLTDRVPAEVKVVNVTTGKYSGGLSDETVSVYYRFSEEEEWIKLGESKVDENIELTMPEIPEGKAVLDIQWRFSNVMPGFGETERPSMKVETLEVVQNGDVIHNLVALTGVVAGIEVVSEDTEDTPVGPFGIVITQYKEEGSGKQLLPDKKTYGFIDTTYDVTSLKLPTIGALAYTRTDGVMTGSFTEEDIIVVHWYKPPKTGAAPYTTYGLALVTLALGAAFILWVRKNFYNKLTKCYEFPFRRK